MNDYEEIYGIPKWHGAEAKIYIIDYKDTKAIFKHRLSKEYRHSSLDREIRITRHRQEVKCMKKALEIGKIIVPKIYNEDVEKSTIIMEYFERAIKLKDALNLHPENEEKWAKMFGSIIGKLHDLDIIHGDLTTSNILIETMESIKEETKETNQTEMKNGNLKTERLILIDFGLSLISSSKEDKAVDLHVLQRAIEASHSNCPHFFSHFLEAYRKSGNDDLDNHSSITNDPDSNNVDNDNDSDNDLDGSNNNRHITQDNQKNSNKKENNNDKDAILQRLRVVQARGRKRTMIG